MALKPFGCLGGALGTSWASPGRPLGAFGGLWGVFGVARTPFGCLLGGLGGSLVSPGRFLGAFGDGLGAFWRLLDAFREALGAS